jgi:hypothetical protein
MINVVFNIRSISAGCKISVVVLFLVVFFCSRANAQISVLFDATKGESAGNADWIIDADAHNISWNPNAYICGACSESNAQQLPSPAQPAAGVTVAETYWQGGLSYWALDCAYKGYKVETLPALTGRITYGDNTNAQDLSHYDAFMVCEPNIKFTAAEKTALLDYVRNGGGLFVIADHDVSDRNGDGFDSPGIWNDLFQINSTGNTNPFGIQFSLQNFSEISTNVAVLPPGDSILHGSWGNVAKVQWSGGTSITISPTANASVKAVVYKTGGSGNINVLVAYARYGLGRVVAVGDSSPFDDGTGDINDNLFYGYTGDVPPNHRNLIMNSTIWLVTNNNPITYVFTGNGNWDDAANWGNNLIPPGTLPAKDSIVINHIAGGICVLNVTQHMAAGATLKVNAGKTLLIPGLLQIE